MIKTYWSVTVKAEAKDPMDGAWVEIAKQTFIIADAMVSSEEEIEALALEAFYEAHPEVTGDEDISHTATVIDYGQHGPVDFEILP